MFRKLLYLTILICFLIVFVYGETNEIEDNNDYKFVENIDLEDGLDMIEYTEYVEELDEINGKPTVTPKPTDSPCKPKCGRNYVCKDYVCQLKCQFVLCKPNYFCAKDTIGFGYCLPNSKK